MRSSVILQSDTDAICLFNRKIKLTFPNFAINYFLKLLQTLFVNFVVEHETECFLNCFGNINTYFK